MTQAIIAGMVANKYPVNKIIASNPSASKLEQLQTAFAIQTTHDNNQAIAQAEVVVLAVKPQLMATVCQQFDKTNGFYEKLFISIAAGINSQRLQAMLQATGAVSTTNSLALIRTMPNTPSAIGKGLTGLYSDNANEQQRQFAESLFNMVGKTVWAKTEADIDAVIAAAGSSPAYFFLMLEAMQEKTQALGFDRDAARLMVQQAMLGAAEMVCNNPELELSELRAQVTSKGGTTAQAIAHFQEQQFAQIVADAMQAAVNRAQQMSNSF